MHDHDDHDHDHGEDCGHTKLKHGDHVDFVHDGHLHHPKADGGVEEHKLEVSADNPADCKPHDCSGHDAGHVHGPDCGHEAVPHGDHTCYIVDGHLHHPHGDHCDDHGKVELV